jgi:prepilin-type N-terminal cleavage/methylation domain-containing protein
MSRSFTNCNSHRGRRRLAFTLVEVLVVIAIIGLLVGLLLPAINAAKKTSRRTAIKAEMTQLAAALENFRTQIGGGQYPPDGTDSNDMQRFCKAAWPRAAWGGGVAYPACAGATGASGKVGPDNALIFWLCGAQDASGAFIGFSANASNPFDASASRLPVCYEQAGRSTDTTRFNQTGALSGVGGTGVVWSLFQMFPPNGKDPSSGSPYLYFKAVASNYCTGTGKYQFTLPSGTSLGTASPTVYTYVDSTAGNAPVNPTTFQLLCPGLDGVYGQAANPNWPSGTNYDTKFGLDDMTNFTRGQTVSDDSQQ